MKKVLFIFVALISMLAMTSCDDKEKCVGSWVSESFSEDGFKGNIYLDLMENGKATLIQRQYNVKSHATFKMTIKRA